MYRTPMLLLCAVAAGGTALAAQQPAPRRGPPDSAMRGMMRQQQMGMMPAEGIVRRAMHLTPAHLLAHREALDLTADQVRRLEQLARGDSAAGARGDARPVTDELSRLFNADRPDTAAVRAAAERVLAAHTSQLARRIATAAAVRGILTPAQREQAMLLPPGGMGMMAMGGMMPMDMQHMMRMMQMMGGGMMPGGGQPGAGEHEHGGLPEGRRQPQ